MSSSFPPASTTSASFVASGSVISAQKVLFWILFIAGFEHFLCTNQRN